MLALTLNISWLSFLHLGISTNQGWLSLIIFTITHRFVLHKLRNLKQQTVVNFNILKHLWA